MHEIISREELKKLIEREREYILIDVRLPKELQYGMIPTAHNIPLPELDEALDLPNKTFEQRYHFTKPTKTRPW